MVYEKARAMRPLPASVCRLAALVADDDSTIDAVVAAVESDPVLIASLLREANSASSSSVEEITTVRAAVVRLGFGRTLVASTAAAVGSESQAALPAYDLRVGEMWKHATTGAVAAEIVRQMADVPLDPGVATAALLHDIGQVLLNDVLQPSRFSGLINCGMAIDEAEREIVDLDHAETGAVLLELWDVPPVIVEAVRWHHQPGSSERAEAHAVSVASHLAAEILFEAESQRPQRSGIEESLLTLGIDEVAVIDAVIAQAMGRSA